MRPWDELRGAVGLLVVNQWDEHIQGVHGKILGFGCEAGGLADAVGGAWVVATCTARRPRIKVWSVCMPRLMLRSGPRQHQTFFDGLYVVLWVIVII